MGMTRRGDKKGE
jgi:hypothetical protein